MLIVLENRKKNTMPSEHYSQEYWSPVWSHSLCNVDSAGYIQRHVFNLRQRTSTHVLCIRPIFPSSSFISPSFFFLRIFFFHNQTGDACFALRVCDTLLNPCYFSVVCELRWSCASSDRSFYGCSYVGISCLQSHRSVILGVYHIRLGWCQSSAPAIPFLKPFKDGSSGCLYVPAKLSCCLHGTVLSDQKGR